MREIYRLFHERTRLKNLDIFRIKESLSSRTAFSLKSFRYRL